MRENKEKNCTFAWRTHSVADACEAWLHLSPAGSLQWLLFPSLPAQVQTPVPRTTAAAATCACTGPRARAAPAPSAWSSSVT